MGLAFMLVIFANIPLVGGDAKVSGIAILFLPYTRGDSGGIHKLRYIPCSGQGV